MKKAIVLILLAALLVSAMAGCSDWTAAGKKVGISLPGTEGHNWEKEAVYLAEALEAEGMTASYQLAEDAETQARQIENMISDGCDALIITPIGDGSALSEALAKTEKIKTIVIAYGAVIRDSDAVDYCVLFDSRAAGRMQGACIRDALSLNATPGPYLLEIFSGGGDGWDDEELYEGAMQILQPYIDDGSLVVGSGQISLEDITAAQAAGETEAEDGGGDETGTGSNGAGPGERLEALLQSYGDERPYPDAILCGSDETALEVAGTLDGMGCTRFPVITGRDCLAESVQNIIDGRQTMSVYRDGEALADRTVRVLVGAFERHLAKTEDGTFNGTIMVPCYFCDPVYVDVWNYQAVLIDSGVYAAEQFVIPEPIDAAPPEV